ncbi:MAG: hypothetical protein E7392_02185 [Ruminococcaceae bacterium]|nr:hypothetical protein [Oscillospiraceae bacterium]
MTYEEIVSFVSKNIKKTAAKKVTQHIAVEFDIYGEGEGAFYVEVSDGVVVVAPYEYYDRDAKVFISGEELVKIINDEKTVTESISDGVMMVEGDNFAVEVLMGVLKATAKKTPAKKPAAKKTAAKKTTAKKTVKAEKEIVEMTKKPESKVAKDIKK